MQKMEVDVPHRLSRDEARARLNGITERLARDYSAACNWEGSDRLLVKRKGLEASLDVAEDKVHVDLEFGLFMRPFASTIRAGIVKQLTELLA
jgi:putative polyhydroxyalkanoate system protein